MPSGRKGARSTKARAAKDDSFRAFVLEQLEDLDGVRSRSMFGGHGLYRDEVFFGIVFKGRLYFKVSEETHPRYASRGMKPFRPTADQTLGSYYEVPLDVLEDRRQLARWAEEAVACGARPRRGHDKARARGGE